MKKSHLLSAVCAVLFSLITVSANAELIGRLPATPGGSDWQAYYDDEADLSWTANANINGLMNWDAANTWAAALDIDGVTGWRLPTTTQPDPSCSSQGGAGPFSSAAFNCTGSEMGNLWYNVLGLNGDSGVVSDLDFSPFTNMTYYNGHWSSTELAWNPTQGAWSFLFGSGYQQSAPKDFSS